VAGAARIGAMRTDIGTSTPTTSNRACARPRTGLHRLAYDRLEVVGTPAAGDVVATVTITNSGRRAGKEVVQL
jgi:hypothetical protein